MDCNLISASVIGSWCIYRKEPGEVFAPRFMLKTRAADMNAYRVFAGNVLWQLPGVRETRTYAVMEEVKHSNHLHLHV